MSVGVPPPLWKGQFAGPDHYWATRMQPYRGLLASMLSHLKPWTSLLELGSHVGANLYAIRQQWPNAALMGLDLNAEFVVAGAKLFRHEGVEGVELFQANLMDPGVLDAFQEIDVVLSCYSLAYMPPIPCARVIVEAMTLAKRGLIIVEPQHIEGRPDPVLSAQHPAPRWVHDYLAMASPLISRGGWEQGRFLPFAAPDPIIDKALLLRRTGA